jgi:hypothetical protein
MVARLLQVVASWNLTGLDEATADRLYEKVKAQTMAGPQPESLKMTYLDEWLQANVQAGSVLVDDPKVLSSKFRDDAFSKTAKRMTYVCTWRESGLTHLLVTLNCYRENRLMAFGKRSRWWTRRGGDRTQRMPTCGL